MSSATDAILSHKSTLFFKNLMQTQDFHCQNVLHCEVLVQAAAFLHL